MKMKIEDVAQTVRKSGYIVALTGAGISTNAGIPDFRGAQGIYTTRKYSPNVFDIVYFLKDPSIFYDYARDFLEFSEKLEPTFTHRYLAELEKSGRLKCVITQNIDGLHQRAGSRNVIEVHGGYTKSSCLKCGEQLGYEQLKKRVMKEKIPKCHKCGGLIKPDIVFFGEAVKGIREAAEIASKSDLLLVIGTTLTVYPAAAIPDVAKRKIIIVNKGYVASDRLNAIRFDCDIDEFFRNISKNADSLTLRDSV